MSEHDYILVGAGVAAATVARKLLEADRATSILILEAGPRVPERDRRGWWNYVIDGSKPYDFARDKKHEYETVGGTFWDFYDNRVMAYGGSTLHWGGWSLRLQPEDFHMHDNTGEGVNWPFDYWALHHYYHQAENQLSVCGQLSESWNSHRRDQEYPVPAFKWAAPDGEMYRAFTDLGIEPGLMPIARYRKCMMTGTCKYCPLGGRFTAQHLLDEIESDPRHKELRIACRATVRRIIADSKSKVSGVEYLDNDGNVYTASAARVVLCSGAYESPKLLMLSTSSFWPAGIGNQNDLVGRFIVSHSMLFARGHQKGNAECWLQEYDFPTIMSRTYDSPAYQREGKLFLFRNRAIPKFDFAEMMIQGRRRDEIERLLAGAREVELQGFLEEKGRFDDRLTLGEGRNQFGLPFTRVSFSRPPEVLAQAHNRLGLMQAVVERMNYTVDRQLTKVDHPGGHHTTGTCRMSHSARDGVVDPNLRVHDVDNLYICSNAVFPTGSAVNPTLTLTALSLRLADHLLGRPYQDAQQPLPQKKSKANA